MSLALSFSRSVFMNTNKTDQLSSLSESPAETMQQSETNIEADLKLSRWLV
jgi:hypothetical protein